MGCSPSREIILDEEFIVSKTPEYLCRTAQVKHSFGLAVEVKGVSDAVLSLCGPQESVDYELIIGSKKNTSCLLRSIRDPELSAQCESICILDESGYRGFWLTWGSSNQICLGKGYRPGQQELLSVPAMTTEAPAPHEPKGTSVGYRPYCIKVSCLNAGARAAFRGPRLLFEGDV